VASCPACRVALVSAAPGGGGDRDARRGGELVSLGTWPRLSAQILRARLETAGISVFAQWADPLDGPRATLVVPADQAEFGAAVVHEIDVDDEVPDTSPVAYVARIEEHLSVVAELLDELRTRLDAAGDPGGPDDGP